MAAYTALTSELLETFLAHYELRLLHWEPLMGGMANTSFVVNGEYVLTVLNNHSFDSAKALVDLTAAINSAGVATPVAMACGSG